MFKIVCYVIEVEVIINYLFNVVMVDFNELVEVVIGVCWYCWGYDILYFVKYGEYKINYYY